MKFVPLQNYLVLNGYEPPTLPLSESNHFDFEVK